MTTLTHTTATSDKLPGDVPSLDRVRMRAIGTADAGEVDVGTLFEFRQLDDVVTASYAGGSIVAGSLVGVRAGSSLEFRYAQVNTQRRVDGGHSHCDLTVGADGRIRLVERFEWNSRVGTGSNLLEQVPDTEGTLGADPPAA